MHFFLYTRSEVDLPHTFNTSTITVNNAMTLNMIRTIFLVRLCHSRRGALNIHAVEIEVSISIVELIFLFPFKIKIFITSEFNSLVCVDFLEYIIGLYRRL